MSPLIVRQAIHGEKMTVERFEILKGGIVPEHSHHHEQISMVEKGRLRFLLNGEEVIAGAGETVRIAPHLPHSVEALEDGSVVDLFSPPREDWIRGDDAYLRKSDLGKSNL